MYLMRAVLIEALATNAMSNGRKNINMVLAAYKKMPAIIFHIEKPKNLSPQIKKKSGGRFM